MLEHPKGEQGVDTKLVSRRRVAVCSLCFRGCSSQMGRSPGEQSLLHQTQYQSFEGTNSMGSLTSWLLELGVAPTRLLKPEGEQKSLWYIVRASQRG